jgi:PhnB protein
VPPNGRGPNSATPDSATLRPGQPPPTTFNGNARQALESYRSVFGGTLNINTYADFGGKDSPDADKVMHGQLENDAGYTVMASDHASNMGDYHPRLASGSA